MIAGARKQSLITCRFPAQGFKQMCTGVKAENVCF
jgi:hypothetical protein